MSLPRISVIWYYTLVLLCKTQLKFAFDGFGLQKWTHSYAFSILWPELYTCWTIFNWVSKKWKTKNQTNYSQSHLGLSQNVRKSVKKQVMIGFNFTSYWIRELHEITKCLLCKNKSKCANKVGCSSESSILKWKALLKLLELFYLTSVAF